MLTYHTYAAPSAKAPLEPFAFDPGPLGPEEVEIEVSHCGLCHSDLSMLDNDWGMSKYPFVPGHEVTGTVSALGDSKEAEARKLGAHYVHNTKQDGALKKIAGSLDLIISTVNAGLDVPGVLDTLAPKGRLHNVGAVLDPLQVPAFSLIAGQKSVSGSPSGSPTAIDDMLEFSARHSIAPIIETFPMSQVNKRWSTCMPAKRAIASFW